ncbi:MAG: MBL fold metallo-hydrolase [Pseudomonadota bacterium]
MTGNDASMTRRTALLGAAASGTATAALVSGAALAVAKAPMMGAAAPTFRRIKLGNFEVTTVFDGFGNVPRVHPIFGQNQSAEAVAAQLKANNLPPDKMQIGFTPVVVNTGNEVVLFDTGNGSGRGSTRGKLLTALAAAGFTPDMIDIVVITHMHPDHVSGMIADGKPVFPNARYVTGEVEHNFWTSDATLNSSDKGLQGRVVPIKANVLPLNEQFTFLKGGNDVVTGITAIEAFGHTPGHLVFNIESEGRRLLLWADVCNHYVVSLQKPEWHVVFDMDKDAAIAARKKVLDMAAADRIAATGYHMPFPSIGFVEKIGDMHRWVAATYQFAI